MSPDSSALPTGHIQRDRTLLSILAAGSLAVMPGAVIAPVLPEIVHQFQWDKARAGYLVSAHFLTVALCSPLLGILADRLGRVRILIVSLVLFSGFGIAGTWANSFLSMLTTRALLGAATGGIAAASLGLLAQLYPDRAVRSQAIAYATTTLTLANIVYPLLAGLLGTQGWQVAFYLYGLGIPLALLVATTLREQAIAPSIRQPQSVSLVQALRNPQILQLLLSIGVASATAYATVVYLPMYLRATLQTQTLTNGLILASQALGAAASSALLANRLAQRFGSGGAIAIGLGGVAIAAALLPQLQSLPGFFPVAILFGASLGIAIPNHYAALANLAPPDRQASVLASATGMNFLGQFVSPLLFGIVVRQAGLTAVFYAAAGVAVTTGILLMTAMRRQGAA